MMTSHLLVPAVDDVPATISARFSNLIRTELAFAGPIVTDALDMHGISGTRSIPSVAALALRAGADLLCLGARQDSDVPTAVAKAITADIDAGLLERMRERGLWPESPPCTSGGPRRPPGATTMLRPTRARRLAAHRGS